MKNYWNNKKTSLFFSFFQCISKENIYKILEKDQTKSLSHEEFNKVNLIILSIIKNNECSKTKNWNYADFVQSLVGNQNIFTLKDFNKLLVDLNKKINLNVINEDNDYFFKNCEQVS